MLGVSLPWGPRAWVPRRPAHRSEWSPQQLQCGGPRCQGHDLSCSGSGSRSFSAPLRTHRSGWEAEACPLGVLWGEHDGGRLSSRLGSSCPLGWQVSAVSYRKTLQLFSGLSDDRESELFSVSPRHSGANR